MPNGISPIRRFLTRPTVAAAAIGLVVAIWMLTGEWTAQPADAAASPQASSTPPDPSAAGPLIELRRSIAQPVAEELLLRGQLEPLRVVQLRAETEGRVTEVAARKGQRVHDGAILLRLAMDDREARRTEASALVHERQEQAEAAERLFLQQMVPQTLVSQRLAELAVATAARERIEIEIGHTRLRAPFAAILNDLTVELGDFVQRGDVVAVLVDDAEVLVTAQVPQQYIGELKPGQTARARLLSGEQLTGTVRYLSWVADVDTRSFRVEVAVDNRNRRLVTGTSVELAVPVKQASGHFVASSVLTTVSGVLATAIVDQGEVAIRPVTLLRSEPTGVWIGGLANEATIIVAGQGYLTPGQRLTVQDGAQPDGTLLARLATTDPSGERPSSEKRPTGSEQEADHARAH